MPLYLQLLDKIYTKIIRVYIAFFSLSTVISPLKLLRTNDSPDEQYATSVGYSLVEAYLNLIYGR